jgi:transcription initiation factor TFIIIB Brf1 subunit/transcription initiation factor TFIIB
MPESAQANTIQAQAEIAAEAAPEPINGHVNALDEMLDADTIRYIERLAADLDVDTAVVLKQAIEVYQLLRKERAGGADVLISKGGNVQRLTGV